MLKLEGVSKTFYPGTVNEKRALNKVSLHLAPGDFATVVGSNGAGKSTLFNAICGVFYADEGSILLGGEDVTFKPEYRRSREIGRLFQDPMKGTAPHMTIEENLSLAYLRTAKNQNAFFARVGKKDRDFFREQLAVPARGPAVRRPAPGADPDDGHHGAPQAAAAGRAHRRSGPGHGGKSFGYHPPGGAAA